MPLFSRNRANILAGNMLIIQTALPRIGSFQPPVAAPAQHASRIARQSAVDWLMAAIVLFGCEFNAEMERARARMG